MKPPKVIIKQREKPLKVIFITGKHDKGYEILTNSGKEIILFEQIEYICSYSREIYKRMKSKPAN